MALYVVWKDSLILLCRVVEAPDAECYHKANLAKKLILKEKLKEKVICIP